MYFNKATKENMTAPEIKSDEGLQVLVHTIRRAIKKDERAV